MLTGSINGKLSQWVGLMLLPQGLQSRLLSGQLNVKPTQSTNVKQHKGYWIDLTSIGPYSLRGICHLKLLSFMYVA